MISKIRNKQFFLGLGIVGIFLTTSLKSEELTASVEHSPSSKVIIPDQKKYELLVKGQYFGWLRLKYEDTEEYIGEYEYSNDKLQLQNFFQDPDGCSFLWNTHHGIYNYLEGYWIYDSLNRCWQADYDSKVEHTSFYGSLGLWNLDREARGNPENWELFVFQPVDADNKKVYVKNVSGKYIRYVSPGFKCDADVSQAAKFLPLFE